ncbi:hypothetical protein VTK73DRAFT_6602 [Phialemonium thermophilum]|uniref:Uncharacterized protein n=1 Tax=Phialemonium thermophilum TaxID=223376 RepID=A0ABR3WIQ8_9PEZI
MHVPRGPSFCGMMGTQSASLPATQQLAREIGETEQDLIHVLCLAPGESAQFHLVDLPEEARICSPNR